MVLRTNINNTLKVDHTENIGKIVKSIQIGFSQLEIYRSLEIDLKLVISSTFQIEIYFI